MKKEYVEQRVRWIWTGILFALAVVLIGILTPVEARAQITVTGGVEGVDYTYDHTNPQLGTKWSEDTGNWYEKDKASDGSDRGLNILTSTPLTISGDNRDETGMFKSAIFIEDNITANLTIRDLTMRSSAYSGCIVLRYHSTLNLTIEGNCNFSQEELAPDMRKRTTYYNSIVVPWGATLNITEASSGTLTALATQTAVIGEGQLQGESGNIQIGGGHLKLTSQGGYGDVNRYAMCIGSFRHFQPVTISGGLLELSTDTPGHTTSEFDYVTIGTLNDKDAECTGDVRITGGTVISRSNGHLVGIGRDFSPDCSGNQMKTIYAGGNVAAARSNTQIVNENGETLYRAEITLEGVSDGKALTGYEYLDKTGLHTVEIQNAVTILGGKYYAWLPEGKVLTCVKCDGKNYRGAALIQKDQDVSAAFTLEPQNGYKKILREEYWPKTGDNSLAGKVFLSKKTGLAGGETVVVYFTPPEGKLFKGAAIQTANTGKEPEEPQTVDLPGLQKISDNCISFQIPEDTEYHTMRDLMFLMSYDERNTGEFEVTEDTCNVSYDNGVLKLSGTGKARVSLKPGLTKTADRIEYADGANVDLTIRDIHIETVGNSCIRVNNGAGDCRLILEGTNTIITNCTETRLNDSPVPTLFKGAGTSTLTILGKGSLRAINQPVTSSEPILGGPAIGSDRSNGSDSVVTGLKISGGQIHAETKNYRETDSSCLAIGGGFTGHSGCNWEISGGTIDAIGGGKMNFGKSVTMGAFSCAITENIRFTAPVITGGSVKVTDISQNSEIDYVHRDHPMYRQYDKDKDTINGQLVRPSVYLTTITLQETSDAATAVKNTRVTGIVFGTEGTTTYGTDEMYTDDQGKIYIWLQPGTRTLGVRTENGTYTGEVTTTEITYDDVINNKYTNWYGDAAATFTKSDVSLDFSKAVITFTDSEDGEYVYTGEEITPQIKVTIDAQEISADNYTVAYYNNTDIGAADVEVTAKGLYTGSKAASFQIIGQEPGMTTDPVARTGLTYNGAMQNLITPGEPTGGVIQYRVKATGDATYGGWSSLIPQARDAGTYAVQYRILGSGIYRPKDETTVSENIRIQKAKLTATVKNESILYKHSLPDHSDNMLGTLEFEGLQGDDTIDGLKAEGKITGEIQYAYPAKLSGDTKPVEGRDQYRSGSPVGDYWIAPNYGETANTTLQIDNYDLTFVNGILHVANEGVQLTVIHEKQQLDGSYMRSGAETTTTTVNAHNPVTPEVNQYPGFTSPKGTEITPVPGNTNEVIYRYARKPYTVTLKAGTGISAVALADGGTSGSYLFGQNVTVSATAAEGYENVHWTGDRDTTSFMMPAQNVTMTAVAEKKDEEKESENSENSEVETAPLTEVPAAIREQYPTVELLEEALLKVLKVELSDDNTSEERNGSGQIVKHKLMDVSVYVVENGVKRKVTREDFPKEGLEVLIPYPEGTDASFDFSVAHVFAEEMNGFKAGDIETPAVVKTRQGLKTKFKGLSPVMVTWVAGSQGEQPSGDEDVRFVDVQDANKWYYTPVYWAVGKNVTSGVDKTHFGPDQTCTRAQSMTFLYRVKDMTRFPGDGLYGASEASNRFVDVPEGKWYTEPVAWAVSEGITAGTGDNTFGTNDPCTRAQIATFLWRAAGSPEPASTASFSDVPEGKWYSKAIAWALEKGVTAGIGNGKFGTNDPCTRAQIMTFLWRIYH